MTRDSLRDCLNDIEEVYNNLDAINNCGKMDEVLDELYVAKCIINCILDPESLSSSVYLDVSDCFSDPDSDYDIMEINDIMEILGSWGNFPLSETVSVNADLLDNAIDLGEGIVDQVYGNEITVSFPDRTVVFRFPEAFIAGLLTNK